MAPSAISVEGALGVVVSDPQFGPAEAFLDREFAHGHAQGDRSLRLNTDPDHR